MTSQETDSLPGYRGNSNYWLKPKHGGPKNDEGLLFKLYARYFIDIYMHMYTDF